MPKLAFFGTLFAPVRCGQGIDALALFARRKQWQVFPHGKAAIDQCVQTKDGFIAITEVFGDHVVARGIFGQFAPVKRSMFWKYPPGGTRKSGAARTA